MSSVLPFKQKSHVRIESGRCTGGDDPLLDGKWVYAVVLVDDEGLTFIDYVGPSRHDADTAAVALARDFGIRIVDNSTEAPR